MNKYPFETRFAKYNSAGSVGLAAMVIKNGETIFKEGYGFGNIETKEPIDANTNFRLASVSKQFTAMCIAILEENGELSANEPIKKYFEDLPNFMDEIKIHHLLHHTSGLPDYNELCSTNKELPLLKNADIYNFYKSKKNLNFKPGNQFEYCNGGYNLLATLVEKVTKETFSEFITKNIFTPLGMLNTRVVSYPIKIPRFSVSYSGWPFFDDIDFNTGNALIGEDGIYCSLNDTEKWIRAIEYNTLVDKEMMRKVFTSGLTNAGDKVNYGYGWCFDSFYKNEIVFHTGLWCGFNTAIVNFPEENIWIVSYSNSLAISAGYSMEEIARYFLNTK